VTRLGTKSFTIRQELVQDDAVAIRGDCVLVLFDITTDASRPMADDERAYWSRYLAE
jgi:acyl-CoA thioester hydrolase